MDYNFCRQDSQVCPCPSEQMTIEFDAYGNQSSPSSSRKT